METYLILFYLIVGLFTIASSLIIIDGEDKMENYPFGYHFYLKHRWSKYLAIGSCTIATILCIILPVFIPNTLPAIPSFLRYIILYVAVAFIWFIGQPIIFFVCLLCQAVFMHIWYYLRKLFRSPS